MIRPEIERAARAVIKQANRDRAAKRTKPEKKPVTFEPGAGTPRKAMGASRRGRIIDRQEHRCARCHEHVAAFEIDHILPLELGGADDDDNLQALCGRCHRAKTNADVARIAKAKRQAKMMGPLEPSRHPIRSRGFQ